MSNRQEIDCELIKTALKNINSRLNYLQSKLPSQTKIEKDPIVPKLNLSLLGITTKENQQKNVIQSKKQNNLLNQALQQRGRSKSLFNNQISFLNPQNISNEINFQSINHSIDKIQNQQWDNIQHQLKREQCSIQNQFNLSRNNISLHVTPQNSTPVKMLYQQSRNITPQKIIVKSSQPFLQQPQCYVKIVQTYQQNPQLNLQQQQQQQQQNILKNISNKFRFI